MIITHAPGFLAGRANDPHQAATHSTAGDAHPLVDGEPVAEVVPAFASVYQDITSGH